MPTTRKPKPYRHPRSLDALFPMPKKRKCARGHGQTPEWKAAHGCSTCRKQDVDRAEAERMAAYAGAAEREHWLAILPPLPNPIVMRSTDGRSVSVFWAGPRRRGPARRGAIRKRA